MNHHGEGTIGRPGDPAAEQMLIIAARNGDEQAFESLFKRHKQKILGVVRRYANVQEDAEDIAQEAFQKAFLHLCQFEGRSSFSTWLTSIAIHEALMFLRGVGAMREIPIDGMSDAEENAAVLQIPDSRPNAEAIYLRRERKRILLATIANLTPPTREALELREIRELSMKQTAQCMGASVGAVKTRIFRAKRELRQRLTEYLKSNSKSRTSTARMGGALLHTS